MGRFTVARDGVLTADVPDLFEYDIVALNEPIAHAIRFFEPLVHAAHRGDHPVSRVRIEFI